MCTMSNNGTAVGGGIPATAGSSSAARSVITKSVIQFLNAVSIKDFVPPCLADFR